MIDEGWIRASEAYARVQEHILRAGEAICERAHDGMIAARAERLILGKKVIEPADVPSEFWWARGRAAMTAKWPAGDFETWIDNRIHCRAYGVEFARADIEKMLPQSARRTGQAHPTVGNFEPASRCLAELTAAIDGDRERAIELILTNCRAGLISTKDARIFGGETRIATEAKKKLRRTWKFPTGCGNIASPAMMRS